MRSVEPAVGAEAGSVEDAVTGADAVLVLTEWQHYAMLNWHGSGRTDAQAGMGL